MTDDQFIEKYERLTAKGIQKVILMTYHKSKGLEFDTVVMIDFDIDAPTPETTQ